MAGTLYLGRTRVCPAILVGGSPEPETNDKLLIKMPDGVMTSSNYVTFNTNGVFSKSGIKFDFAGCTKLDCVSMYDFFNYTYGTQNNVVISSGELKEITGYSSIEGWFGNVSFEEGYTDIYFDNLEKINGGAFFGDMFLDSNITSLHMPKLNDCSGAFLQGVNCGHLYLNSVTSTTFSTADISLLFSGLSNQTMHLPSNMSDIMPNIYGYPNFGGTDTVILYDLEATE